MIAIVIVISMFVLSRKMGTAIEAANIQIICHPKKLT